jgi:hypothetical protein
MLWSIRERRKSSPTDSQRLNALWCDKICAVILQNQNGSRFGLGKWIEIFVEILLFRGPAKNLLFLDSKKGNSYKVHQNYTIFCF